MPKRNVSGVAYRGSSPATGLETFAKSMSLSGGKGQSYRLELNCFCGEGRSPGLSVGGHTRAFDELSELDDQRAGISGCSVSRAAGNVFTETPVDLAPGLHRVMAGRARQTRHLGPIVLCPGDSRATGSSVFCLI